MSTTYTRINKSAARKLFDTKREFWISAVNMRPVAGLLVDPMREPYENYTFDQLCNTFEYYNCNNSEVGRYAAFYTES